MRIWLGLLRSLAIYHNPTSIRNWRGFYREILWDGALALDVGAHVGTRTRAMRAAGARVIAIEPQHPFSGFLRRTLPKDVTFMEMAVGGYDGDVDMAVSSRHPTVSSLAPGFVDRATEATGFGHVRWDRTQRVAMITLDTLIGRFGCPDYVKIDVEGFEIAVLSGLSQPIPLLSVEFLPAMPDLIHPVIDRLLELGGYEFNVVQGETGQFLWPEWGNAVALKSWLRDLPLEAESGDVFARLAHPRPD